MRLATLTANPRHASLVNRFNNFRPSLSPQLQFRVNNFGITNSLQTVIGAGVFEHGAILNHSCHPNAVLVYERKPASAHVQQTIVVIKDVKEGEELTHR